jgi:hypothetical protein
MTRDKVHDVVWRGHRKPDAKGNLPSVGNTVYMEAANWTNTIGVSEPAAVGVDMDFGPNETSFYNARVIGIPTPLWVLYGGASRGWHSQGSTGDSSRPRLYLADLIDAENR